MADPLFERVFEATAARVAVHEPNTARFAAVNPAYADALGDDPQALEGQSLLDIAAQDGTALTGAIERALSGDSEQVETLLKGSSGVAREITMELDTITEGEQVRLVSSISSIGDPTDEAAPTPSERRLEVALAGTDTGVWEWDMASDTVIWTESMERLFGLEPGTFGGTFEDFVKWVHPEDLSAVQTAIENAIESGEMFQTEYRIERTDGEKRWVHARGELQETVDGAGRIVGIVTDITDRKRTERALRQQEKQYRQLVERLPDAHYTIDSDWRITFCNEALANRLERTVEEIQGTHIRDLLPEVEDTVVERTFQRVMETGVPETFEYQHESGRWVRVQVYPYADGVAAVSTDVSDQREELLSILDATPIVVYRFDRDGVFQDVRGEMLSRLGLEPDDLIGDTIFEAYAGNDHVIAAAKRALSGESFRYTATLDDITFETHYKPVRTDGEVTSVIGVSMDVTELQRQRERMEFFNSILRHDVLNGMTVIKMRAELLADELDGDHAQYAQTIVDWCNTTTEVTKRVRRVVETLATPDEEHRLEPIDVSAILRRKVHELGNAYPEVTFETAVPDQVRVRADELLSDVLGNVLTNSLEHNDTDGLRIETAVETAADTVQIRIADDGVGIEDDRKRSVFRRGETSHAKETGSGFGLFFVDVMIEKYGGEVRIEDSGAGGACFVVELSLAGEH
ncbi:PAS domain S-box protein [Halobellus rarus]|uniref:histidine kinase n=1 Tax=Halobellus rarus TaxID=1126237 RepID=A0ABD6CLR4_9EURY|nr:PAS domain S-box protein [Halobellus rarus]